MDLMEAGFDILVILNSAGSDVINPDVDHLLDFLQEYYESDIDEDIELNHLNSLDQKELIDLFTEAAEYFNSEATEEEKEAMINFIIEIIQDNSEIPEELYNYLTILSEVWDYDLEGILAEKYNKMDDYSLDRELQWEDEAYEEAIDTEEDEEMGFDEMNYDEDELE